MSSLQLYAYNGLEVRTQLIDGEPWFVLNDLCKVLGIGNSRMVVDRIDPDGVSKTDTIDSLGRRQESTIVDESNMYEVVIRSNGLVAKPFRKWITGEVLPSIRRTGSYSVSAPKSLEEMTLEVMGALNARVTEQAAQLVQQAPMVAQAELSRDADGYETVGDLANRIQLWAASNHPSYKVLHKDVWDLAGELKVIIRGNTARNNQPTSQAIKADWVRVKETVVETNHGNVLKTSIRLTPRGTARIWDAALLRISTAQPLTTQKELV